MDRQQMDARKKSRTIREIRKVIEETRQMAFEMQEGTIGALLNSALEATQWSTSPPPKLFDGLVAGYNIAIAEGLADRRLKGTPLHEALERISNYISGKEEEESDRESPEMLFGNPELPGNCIKCGMHLNDLNPYRICHVCQEELRQKEIEESGGRVDLKKLFEPYRRQIPVR